MRILTKVLLQNFPPFPCGSYVLDPVGWFHNWAGIMPFIVFMCSKSFMDPELFLDTSCDSLAKVKYVWCIHHAASKQGRNWRGSGFCSLCSSRYEGRHGQWGVRWTMQLPPFYPKTSFSFIGVASVFSKCRLSWSSHSPYRNDSRLCTVCATPALPGAFSIC